jgi:DNA-binding response OmpR family regulator
MRPILVVEPHADTADLLVELFGSAGYDVRACAGLDEADEALDGLGPGLLVVTVGPGDRERVGALVRRANERAVPVVLLTTMSERAWAGVGCVLMKPVELEGLLSTIETFYRA